MLGRNIREFLFVAAPKALAGLCTVGINVVLLRFFGPEQYGTYALCVSIVLLSDAILGSALDLGVIRVASLHQEKDPQRSIAVQAAGFYLKVICVFVGTISVSVLAGPLGQLLFHRRADGYLLYFVCAGVLALLSLRSLQIVPQVNCRFLEYGLLELVQMALKYGGIALLLTWGKANAAFVLALLAAGPLLAIAIFTAAWRRRLFPFPAVNWQVVRELVGFVKWYFLTFSVSALVNRADIFLVASWSTLREVGLYSAAQTFAFVPQLLGTYLSVLLSPRIMPRWQAGQFSGFFRGFQLGMFAVCAIIYGAAVVLINSAGQRILPPSFISSQRIILILLPGALAGLLTFPLTLTFLLFVKPRFLVAMDCIALPFMILLYRYAIREHGAVGAAWVTSVSFVLKALIAQIKAWQLARSRRDTTGVELRFPQEVSSAVTG